MPKNFEIPPVVPDRKFGTGQRPCTHADGKRRTSQARNSVFPPLRKKIWLRPTTTQLSERENGASSAMDVESVSEPNLSELPPAFIMNPDDDCSTRAQKSRG